MSDTEKIIEVILGKRGSGKTYLAKKLLSRYDRYLVFDTLGEYRDEGVVIQDLTALAEFWQKVYRGSFRIIYQPLDPEAEFDKICSQIWLCENMAFLVEEVDRFARPLAMSVPFKEIIQRGRHREITFIGVTQRPHGVDKLITSQAKAMYIFNTTEPRDINYFKEVIGEGVIEKFAELKQYEFVKWQDGTETLEIGKS